MNSRKWGILVILALAAGVALGNYFPVSLFTGADHETESHESSPGHRSMSGSSIFDTNGQTSEEGNGSDPASRSLKILEKALRSPRNSRQLLEAQYALYQMNAEQLTEAWNLIENECEENEKWVFIESMFTRWSEVDREAAFEAAKGLNRWLRSSAVTSIMKQWAETDPMGAITHAKSFTNHETKRSALDGILTKQAEKDPALAFQLYKKLLESHEVGSNTWEGGSFFQKWAKKNPELAAKSALEVKEITANQSSLNTVMAVWGRSDPTAALMWLKENGSTSIRSELESSLISGWARSEPELAAAYALNSMTERGTLERALSSVFDAWAGKNFSAAAEWLENTPMDTELRNDARRWFLDHAGWGNRDEVAGYILAHFQEPGMRQAVSGMAWQWGSSNPQEGLEWARENLTDPEAREAFSSRLVQQLANNSPERAIEHLSSISDERLRRNTTGEIASSWARRDPEAAMQWATTQAPEGPERDSAIAGAIGAIAVSNSSGAQAHIDALPEGRSRDAALATAAQNLSYRDQNPATMDQAWLWSSQIGDRNQREYAMENIGRHWLSDNIDRGHVVEFIRNSPDLSDAAKWRLLDAESGAPLVSDDPFE